MNENTLSTYRPGDTLSEQAFVAGYSELRAIAQRLMAEERNCHTLSATALVNEAYLRVGKFTHWDSAGHFFTAVVETMRRVLIDHARARLAIKRQSTRVPLDLQYVQLCEKADLDLALDLDTVLDRLAAEDQEAAELVRLRLFAGLSVSQAGQVLGLKRWSTYQLWDFCQAWFEKWDRLPACRQS